MARITVEDCVDKFDSRFELVLVASNRARKLHSGETTLLEKDNDKNTVIALREIAEESITAEELKNKLIEEYQTVSPIDEEEIDLENSSPINNDKDNNEDIVSEEQLNQLSDVNVDKINDDQNNSDNEYSIENSINENTENQS